MKTLLAGLGTAALGVAVLFTLLLALTTKLFTLRSPSGPDSMGLFVVFLFPAAASEPSSASAAEGSTG